MLEADKIKLELAKVGVSVNDIYDLVNTDKPISKPIDSFLALAQNYKNFKTNDLIYILVFRERILMGSFLLEIE